jgi:hypothetical protein
MNHEPNARPGADAGWRLHSEVLGPAPLRPSVGPLRTRNAKHFLLFLALVLPVLLSGCISQRDYNDLGAGYGEFYDVALLPDSAGHSALLYSSDTRHRRYVWPRLMNGYYGNSVVEDGLIVFQAGEPSMMHPDGALAFFAAKDGPPAVEITKAVRTHMADVAPGASPPDLGYSVEYALLQRTNAGVLISFPIRGAQQQERSEWQAVVITWPEIERLVARIRVTGKTHHFKNVEYYTDD